MKEYTLIYQVETSIAARHYQQAAERAEQVADKLRLSPDPDHPAKRVWWPETVEVTDTTVAEG